MVNVAIIILNWNNSELTLKAAKSIICQNNIVTKVIIADNGSTDCSYDQLKILPKIDLLKFNCNYGFAGGNNRAVKYAMSRYNPEYVLLLNNDAELEGNALNILFDNCEKADILSPKIYYGDRKTLWSCGGKIDLWRSLAWNNGEGEIDRKQYEKSKNIAFASGCALWISKRVIERIGLFDESYFCYYEDVDFSIRAKMNGFSIFYIPEAVVYHKSGVSSGGNKKAMYRSALADLLTLRNRIIFTNKYVRNRIIVTYSSLFVSFLLRILRKKTKRARLILKFMWFGLKGNGKLIREYPITSIMTYKD